MAFLAWAPVAQAWSRPVTGPVLQPFLYDEAHPYASGQHRGIDLGASATGETVIAPAAGTVSFAGTVPTSGKSITIETADGYSVTLTHLGSIVIAKGAAVAERDAVGTVGPSGTPEVNGPYVHLGIRITADPLGYVDPLSLLPPEPDSGTTDGGGSPGTTAQEPAHSGSESKRGAAVRRHRNRAEKPRSETRPRGASERPAVRPARPERRHEDRVRQPQRPRSEVPASLHRPAVEPAASTRPAGLDAGHEIRPAAPAAQPSQPLTGPVPLVLNATAALVALVAVFAARRRRVRPAPSAQVLQLPRRQPERRAA